MFEVFRGWRDLVGSMGRQTDDCNRRKVSDEKRCQFARMLQEQEKSCSLSHNRDWGRNKIPALSWQRATLIEYLVAIQIKAERRHKKEPRAQYATWVGVWKFVASTWASKLGGSVGGWGTAQRGLMWTI
jgi:hypothetical protein